MAGEISNYNITHRKGKYNQLLKYEAFQRLGLRSLYLRCARTFIHSLNQFSADVDDDVDNTHSLHGQPYWF